MTKLNEQDKPKTSANVAGRLNLLVRRVPVLGGFACGMIAAFSLITFTYEYHGGEAYFEMIESSFAIGWPSVLFSCLMMMWVAVSLFAKYKRIDKIDRASRRLAIEADIYACGEGDRDDLESAIEEVEKLTGMRA